MACAPVEPFPRVAVMKEMSARSAQVSIRRLRRLRGLSVTSPVSTSTRTLSGILAFPLVSTVLPGCGIPVITLSATRRGELTEPGAMIFRLAVALNPVKPVILALAGAPRGCVDPEKRLIAARASLPAPKANAALNSAIIQSFHRTSRRSVAVCWV